MGKSQPGVLCQKGRCSAHVNPDKLSGASDTSAPLSQKKGEKNFVKWATFQNGLALLTNYLGDLTLWPRFTSYPCHCAIGHFNIFYLPVDVVAEWQGCLKLFDCSDQEESANLGLKLESKFFSAKSGFFALLNAEPW